MRNRILMGQIYIEFKTDELITDSEQRTEQNRFSRAFQDLLTKVLTTILPKANPDFDEHINNVKKWLLEVDDQDGLPRREIGLDDNGNVIMIMPWRNNYGFWTDSNVQFIELAKYGFIQSEEFERLWNEFDAANSVR